MGILKSKTELGFTIPMKKRTSAFPVYNFGQFALREFKCRHNASADLVNKGVILALKDCGSWWHGLRLRRQNPTDRWHRHKTPPWFQYYRISCAGAYFGYRSKVLPAESAPAPGTGWLQPAPITSLTR